VPCFQRLRLQADASIRLKPVELGGTEQLQNHLKSTRPRRVASGRQRQGQLTREDILAAIAYGAEMSRGRFVDLPEHDAETVAMVDGPGSEPAGGASDCIE
jgi:hypothetical protein